MWRGLEARRCEREKKAGRRASSFVALTRSRNHQRHARQRHQTATGKRTRRLKGKLLVLESTGRERASEDEEQVGEDRAEH